ncbi:hypothetical protein JW905_00020, partial [bacterium]|nr:hypothetical protein [candidate division CSSED10-310 bacterium]
MRKKIFIIHGKGCVDGIGKEGGGDLDTIASNAFYAAWIQSLSPGREAVYGREYQFDFVNYQQGLRHLVVHRGADVYLPDFPIDALTARLRMTRISHDWEIAARNGLAAETDRMLQLVRGTMDSFDDAWRLLVTRLIAFGKSVVDRRGPYEIEAARRVMYLVNGWLQMVADGLEPAIQKEFQDFLQGSATVRLRERLFEVLGRQVKWRILDEIPQNDVEARLAVDEANRMDFGGKGRLAYHFDFMPVALVEVVTIVARNLKLLFEWRDSLSSRADTDLRTLSADAMRPAVEEMHAFRASLGNRLSSQACGTLEEGFQSLIALYGEIEARVVTELGGDTDGMLTVHVARDEHGSPVRDLAVVFSLEKGDGILENAAGAAARVVEARTDDAGVASVRLRLADPETAFLVTATYDDLNITSFRRAAIGEVAGDEESEVDEDLVNDDGGLEARVDLVESGKSVPTDRALAVARALIEDDFLYLADNDVRIVRIDDHHPYTPGILELLRDLKRRGYLEEIQLSSLEKGQEQPKEEQKCGADLIYETFIQGTAADNHGLAYLRDLAHVQDLHIEFSPLAIELSKLIGSKFSKVEMAAGLSRVRDGDEMHRIMQSTGWGENVRKYDAGLVKVLPRLLETLSCIELSETPPERRMMAMQEPIREEPPEA